MTRRLLSTGRPARLVACVALACAVQAASAAAAPRGFVERGGSSLLLNGVPYTFAGFNVYNANSRANCGFDMQSGPRLKESLAAMAPSANVVRAWFFQGLATVDGARDWRAFDKTLAVARARGFKVIATLANQWPDCDDGYGYKTADWYRAGYRRRDPNGTVSYRRFVRQVVTRYRDDPTILMWQLMNEAEVKASEASACAPGAARTLLAWARDMSSLVKSADRNHLVSIGTIGSGQCGAAWREYRRLHALGTVDVCEYHDYSPDVLPGDRWNGLAVRLRQCAALRKPLFVGEVGLRPIDLDGTARGRASLLARKLRARARAGVVGELVWAWGYGGSTLDSYDVGPGDPTVRVLSVYTRAQATRLRP